MNLSLDLERRIEDSLDDRQFPKNWNLVNSPSVNSLANHPAVEHLIDLEKTFEAGVCQTLLLSPSVSRSFSYT